MRTCGIGGESMEFKTKPWLHQRAAIERAKDIPGFGLFFEPGAGKSGTTINILRYKFNSARRVLRTLIFAPPITLKNWCDEWAKHSDLEPSKVIPLTGSAALRVHTFRIRGWHGDQKEGKVFVTNYEALLMPELFKEFERWEPEALVFDESQRIKSHESKRSKAADKLANPPGNKPFKYILSGTPIINSPLDIFMQFKILDGGETFGDNFWGFRARYFHDKNAVWRGSSSRKYYPDWQILPDSAEKMNALIAAKGMQVKKEDCLDLPPLVRQTIQVGMSPEQARVYKELSKQYIAFLNDRTVSAELAIVKALRLMQLASGFVSLDGNGDETDVATKRFGDTPKLAALRELLEDLTPHSKVIIWAVWKENYAQIASLCEELGVEYVQVHGGINDTAKRDAVDRFNRSDTVRVFIGHPGSGGIGINLRAPYSVFYSRTFSLEHSLQAEARNHRGDSKSWGFDKITRYDLVCENSIDQEVVTRLLSKEEIGEKILRNLREKILAN